MSWQGHRDVNENNYYGKQYKDSLPKLKQLPYDPAMPLLGKIPKGRAVCGKAVCITFTAVGVHNVQGGVIWVVPTQDEWIKEEYRLSRKR